VRDLIIDLIQQEIPPGVWPAEVTSVDPEGSTCDVRPLAPGVAPLAAVRLGATNSPGILPVPTVGSTVLVDSVNNEDSAGFVTLAGELDEVRVEAPAVLVKGQVELGDKGGEPAVLGDSLNANLSDLIGQLDTLVGELSTFATAMVTAANANPATAALATPPTALLAVLPAIRGQLLLIDQQLAGNLSQTTSIS